MHQSTIKLLILFSFDVTPVSNDLVLYSEFFILFQFVITFSVLNFLYVSIIHHSFLTFVFTVVVINLNHSMLKDSY